MKLAFLVNDIFTEMGCYTTSEIAMTAMNMGHQIWYISLDKLTYGLDNRVHAKAKTLPKHRYISINTFVRELKSSKAIEEYIDLEEFDVLWLRYDPAEENKSRPWACTTAKDFARIAMEQGVLVVNDPDGLDIANNKMYLQYFPKKVRPRTIITRNPDEIKQFIKQEGGQAVLKPLAGSGGHNVFLIRPVEKVNLNQIIEAIASEGYVIAQQYLSKAIEGDTRMFLLNGAPLTCKNKVAAFQRVRGVGDEDMRSNMSVGASAEMVEVTDEMLEVAEIVRPKLIQDGMFFVGLDIVGDKLMEINVFSPGGLEECEQFEKVKFNREIILSLEKKIEYIRLSNRNFNNTEMAIF